MHKGVKSAAEEFYRKGKIFWGKPSGGTEIFSIFENGLDTDNMLKYNGEEEKERAEKEP